MSGTFSARIALALSLRRALKSRIIVSTGSVMIPKSGRNRPMLLLPRLCPTLSRMNPPSSTTSIPTIARIIRVRSSSMWSPNDMRVSANTSSGSPRREVAVRARRSCGGAEVVDEGHGGAKGTRGRAGSLS